MNIFKRLRVPAVLVLVFGVGFLIRSQFMIRQVWFSSTNAVCVDEALKSKYNLMGNNLLTVNVNQHFITNYPCVKALEYQKIYPDKLKITFIGRVPKMVANVVSLDLAQKEATPSSESAVLETIKSDDLTKLIGSGNKFLVDGDGVLFAQSDKSDIPQINILDGGLKLGSKLGDYTITKILTILERLNQLKLKTSHPALEGADLLVLDDNPQRLYFSLDKDISVELASLQLILQTGKISSNDSSAKEDTLMEKIDLRFDKPVIVYSPKYGKR